MPFALCDGLETSIMRMTTTEWGGALSSFSKDYGWDGEQISEVFSFNTFGLSMDQAVSILKFPIPDYIKLDVDGIEHFILQSSPVVLRQIKGILVEINDDFTEQADQSKKALECAGLTFVEKLHQKCLRIQSLRIFITKFGFVNDHIINTRAEGKQGIPREEYSLSFREAIGLVPNENS